MTYPKPKDSVGLKTICVDLDGTLAQPTWPSPVIGEPIQQTVDAMIEAYKEGWEIVIFTARPAWHHEIIAKWLEDHGLAEVVYDVITGKPRAAAYWDDRAVTFPEGFTHRPRRRHDPRREPGEVHDEWFSCDYWKCEVVE